MVFAPADPAVGCTPGPQPGAVDLANALLHRWQPEGAYSLGIFNCRTIAGTSTYSLHAEGRAFDLGIPESARPRLGDAVISQLLLLQQPIVQRVIWWRQVYDLESPGGRAYSGSDPHVSHLHIEVPWDVAGGLSEPQIAELLGEDDVTDEQLRAALRAVLNEATPYGETEGWAGSYEGLVKIVQGIHNTVGRIESAVGRLPAE